MPDPFLEKRREHCERFITAIENVIEGRATSDVNEIEIGTGTGRRSIAKIPFSELIKIRQQYINELESIKAAEGISPGQRRNVLVRF